MEQRSQPQIEHSHLPSVPPQRSRPVTSTLWRWFDYLLETRPLAFWGGIWVSVLLIAFVAVGSLLSPNAAERRSVSAIAIGSDSAVATQPIEHRGKIPLWLFGAITVTCGAGSVLVSRQLKSSHLRRVTQPTRLKQTQPKPTKVKPARLKPTQSKPTQPKPAQPKQRSRKQTVGTPPPRPISKRQPAKPARHQPKRLKPYSPAEPLLTRVAPRQSAAPTPTSQFIPQQFIPQPAAQSTAVPVTVVPQEQVHPLDWSDRLADSVDLRRQKPVKSWL